MTGSAATRCRPARRPVRPSRSSSVTSTSCASVRLTGGRPAGGRGDERPALRPGAGRRCRRAGAFFLLLDQPEVYGFPPDPIVTTADLPRMWKNAGLAALGLITAAAAARAAAMNEPQRSGSDPDDAQHGTELSGRRRGGGRRRRREDQMVPDATFASYYGRPVVKAAPWNHDIAIYLFAGGVAAGSRCSARGRTCRVGPSCAGRHGSPPPRRSASAFSLWSRTWGDRSASSTCSGCSNRPRRCRWAPGSSPHTLRAPIWPARRGGAAARRARCAGPPARLDRPTGGLAAAVVAPAVASYTAVLLTDTATPAWHDAHRELPVVFVGSAAAASVGSACCWRRRLRRGPPAGWRDRRPGRVGRRPDGKLDGPVRRDAALRYGGRLMRASKIHRGRRRRSRPARWPQPDRGRAEPGADGRVGRHPFRGLRAGQHSAQDPKYTVVPQRERLDRRRAGAEHAEPTPS